MDKGFAAPIWMTFKQALELNAHVRKGEKGSLVVYANSITRTEEDDNGEETEREIHYMKGYTVFNVEQIDGLPEHYYGKPESADHAGRAHRPCRGILQATKADIRYRGDRAFYSRTATISRCRSSRHSAMPRASMRRLRTNHALDEAPCPA
jgi:antirestriction protein ArdC